MNKRKKVPNIHELIKSSIKELAVMFANSPIQNNSKKGLRQGFLSDMREEAISFVQDGKE
ncbi:MAG: hypothetical protein AB1487_07030 [Thermodesulfobacteriota bacterium]